MGDNRKRDGEYYRDVDNNENKPATERQMAFIYSLVERAAQLGKHVDSGTERLENLTVQDAGEMIDDLQRRLGK